MSGARGRSIEDENSPCSNRFIASRWYPLESDMGPPSPFTLSSRHGATARKKRVLKIRANNRMPPHFRMLIAICSFRQFKIFPWFPYCYIQKLRLWDIVDFKAIFDFLVVSWPETRFNCWVNNRRAVSYKFAKPACSTRRICRNEIGTLNIPKKRVALSTSVQRGYFLVWS